MPDFLGFLQDEGEHKSSWLTGDNKVPMNQLFLLSVRISIGIRLGM